MHVLKSFNGNFTQAKKSCRLSFIKNPSGQPLQNTGRRILAEMCLTGQNPARSCPAGQNPAGRPT